MRRADVWESAQQVAAQLLDSLSATDQVALYAIDSELKPIVPLDAQGTVQREASQTIVRRELKQLKATWQRTELGEGLKDLVDLLMASTLDGPSAENASSEVVLISDLASGSHIESLQGFEWPGNIRLDVRQVLPQRVGNARLSLTAGENATGAEATAAEAGGFETTRSQAARSDTFRVRVENGIESRHSTFQLSWADAGGPRGNADDGASGHSGIQPSGADARETRDTGSLSLQVPPGQIRTLSLRGRPADADRVLLSGDEWEVDNIAYIVDPVQSQARLLFCGRQPENVEDDLSYFLKQAPLSDLHTRRDVEVLPTAATPDKFTVEFSARLAEPEVQAVVVEPVEAVVPQAAALRRFAEQGGKVIVCLSRASDSGDRVAQFLSELTEVADIQVDAPLDDAREGDEFALLARIDFQHPVFLPLADPRFNDFGKIHFWSHRRVRLPENDRLKVIAEFDDQAPMLIEHKVGLGHIWLMTSGWQPTASGLGLSSKFLPILMGLLDPMGQLGAQRTSYEVGEAFDVGSLGQNLAITDEDGQAVDAELFERQGDLLSVFAPGLFSIQGEVGTQRVSIQLVASESRLQPLPPEQFEQHGISLSKVSSDAQRLAAMRQMQVEELEGKQRLWQWILVGCLIVLSLETWLAGWHCRT